jgi:hypothetical protein
VANEPVRQQGHQRKQSQQARCGSRDGAMAPLPLTFYTESSSYFLKGHLHWPTPHKPGHDGTSVLREIRTEQGLRVEPPLRVPDQDPANRYGWQTGVIPNRRAGADLDDTITFPLPARYEQALPRSDLVIQEVSQGGQPLSFLPRTAVRAW